MKSALMFGKIKKIKDKQSGQLLVESMVALSLITIGLLGSFAVLTESLAVSRYAADQYLAVALASEGVEIVKNLVDQNFLDGNPYNGGAIGTALSKDYVTVDIYTESTDTLSSGNGRLYKGESPIDSSTMVYSHDNNGTQSKFTRIVRIQTATDSDLPAGFQEYLRVVSIVEWNPRKGGPQKTVVEDHLYNWR